MFTTTVTILPQESTVFNVSQTPTSSQAVEETPEVPGGIGVPRAVRTKSSVRRTVRGDTEKSSGAVRVEHETDSWRGNFLKKT